LSQSGPHPATRLQKLASVLVSTLLAPNHRGVSVKPPKLLLEALPPQHPPPRPLLRVLLRLPRGADTFPQHSAPVEPKAALPLPRQDGVSVKAADAMWSVVSLPLLAAVTNLLHVAGSTTTRSGRSPLLLVVDTCLRRVVATWKVHVDATQSASQSTGLRLHRRRLPAMASTGPVHSGEEALRRAVKVTSSSIGQYGMW
jgi:hypothetical protein